MGVASITGFRVLVDSATDLAHIAGVADPALLIEHPHAHHARFIGHRAHHLVERLAIVAQHVVAGTALDDVTDALGRSESSGLEVLPMKPNVEIAEKTEAH
ncbi:MAG: hypothetical protein DMF61_27415 [Blastocatellia bacterium AA13]|nr:MAG: hypothetical protein DMF61_27415 [Blastocatellia bacterium AA13]